MENEYNQKILHNKNSRIKMLVISSLLLIVSVIGITYAYFDMDIEGIEEASSIRLRTASRMLQYNDVQLVSDIGTLPGWTVTKTLTVKNLSRATGRYNLIWREIFNEVTNDELVMSATCVSNISGKTCDGIQETPIIYTQDKYYNQLISWSIEIDGNETHTYTITFTFKNMGVNQDYNQSKNFGGTLNVADWVVTPETCFTRSSASITNYTCDIPDIIIPNRIDGVDITSIAANALKQKSLTSVVIPKGITSIGNSAFYDNSLGVVRIPNTVVTIGENAFNDNELTSVVIPNTVTTIGNSAFASNQLTQLTIPSSVMTLGNYAFGSGNALESVIIEGKSSTSDFTTYGTTPFNWATGYSDSNIIWTGSGS